MIIYASSPGSGLQSGRLKAVGYEESAVSGVSSLTWWQAQPDISKITAVLFRHEGGPSRMRLDGAVPTSSSGWPLYDGDEFWLSRTSAMALRLIPIGDGNATYRAIYFETE